MPINANNVWHFYGDGAVGDEFDDDDDNYEIYYLTNVRKCIFSFLSLFNFY